jgi:hypothetical protein
MKRPYNQSSSARMLPLFPILDIRHTTSTLSIRADLLILFPLIKILAEAAMLHCSAIRQWLRQNPLKPVS